MIFAPSAAAATNGVPMHGEQLASSLQHHHRHHISSNKSLKNGAEDSKGDKSKRLNSQTKNEGIVEAMKKLDAKLVAYLAGETEISNKNSISSYEEENVVNLSLESSANSMRSGGVGNDDDAVIGGHRHIHLDDELPATKLEIFKTITGVKLEIEALTLQTDGTKRMDLMKSDIRPIFTVECQLSNELIKRVPRHDMFNIMQFESEKFQSLTQCTRFGQSAQRTVQLAIDENGNDVDELNMGRIQFTVWWREPGTCLNEMLGMGVLELEDLYNASLLEQCKRIAIERRGKHLASLYFKIILQRRDFANASLDNLKSHEFFTLKQHSSDNEKNDNSQASDKQQQQAAGNTDAIGQRNNAATNSSAAATDKASADNNNVKLDKSSFDDETSKIRLLKGFIYANETRNMAAAVARENQILICRRFWLDEPAATIKTDGTNKFNYQEQFSVINDEQFLKRVDKQYLHLELWQRMSADDGNGNNLADSADEVAVQPLGMVRMPLHQFFIAYRDAAITNHLCKGKLPVISIDSWSPILNIQTEEKIGEIKCLLAIGSEEQINNLKAARGFLCGQSAKETQSNLNLDKALLEQLKPLEIKKKAQLSSSEASPLHTNLLSAQLKKSSDLLDMLQKVLMTPTLQSQPSASTSSSCCSSTSLAKSSASTASQANLIQRDLQSKLGGSSSCSGIKPLQQANVKIFKFALDIQRAFGLPLNPATSKSKKSSKRNISKRFPPHEAPSTYVTFQADEGQYQTFKSHEGLVYATNIIEKSTQPQWQERFRLAATIDYLNNPQKRFILKVWKKSAIDMTQGRNQPTPMEDAIIGFAALDLNVFCRGLHINGCFNIVDFNGRINGQLEIRCQPLEDCLPSTTSAAIKQQQQQADGVMPTTNQPESVDAVIDQFEQTMDLSHLNLGQAIKRKFTELEGISQRLRARLGDVTGNELPRDFDFQAIDNWQPTLLNANDELDEFDNDLNNIPAEQEKAEQVWPEQQEKEFQGKSENENVRSNE